jgi:hypothetical protein
MGASGPSYLEKTARSHAEHSQVFALHEKEDTTSTQSRRTDRDGRGFEAECSAGCGGSG